MTAKRQRGFEIVSKYKDAGIELPVRKTAASAGYDLQAAEDVILLPANHSLHWLIDRKSVV